MPCAPGAGGLPGAFRKFWPLRAFRLNFLPVRFDKSFVRDHMTRVFYNHKFITEAAVDEIHQILKTRSKCTQLHPRRAQRERDNLLDQLRNIKVPTLLLWGEGK